ncbi:zinc finger protein 726 [Episyrphus balteatus]|uniref:zinc finger protein 726 n=1 Tax=Episyrphus balteatus TaxID=286459 RepID=UPI002486981A|nr:zinc finger protein 726 [Episyrphus balteatus]
MRPEKKYTSDSDLESVFSNEEAKAAAVGKYVCKFGCGQTFKRMVYLDRHEFKHSGIRKHKCFHEGCSKTYTNSQHLKRHLKVFHEEKPEQIKNVNCRFDFCNKMFVSIDNMERHIREVHENPKVYECTQCGDKFTQRLKLRRHEVKHTGVYPYNCSICSKGFVQEYFLTRHICTKTYKCDQCDVTFAKWSELIAHRKALNHKTLHKCDQCSKEFKSQFFLDEHKNCHEDDKEVFKCTYEDCTRFYTYRRNLLQHIRNVHEGKKIQCTVENCEMTLSNKRALEHHIKVIHKKQNNDKPKGGKKERAKRKDAGRRKQSTLSKLSGVFIEKEIDQMIMDGVAEVDIDLPALEAEISKSIETLGNNSAEDQ